MEGSIETGNPSNYHFKITGNILGMNHRDKERKTRSPVWQIAYDLVEVLLRKC